MAVAPVECKAVGTKAGLDRPESHSVKKNSADEAMSAWHQEFHDNPVANPLAAMYVIVKGR